MFPLNIVSVLHYYREKAFDLCAVCGDFVPRPEGWSADAQTEEQLSAEEGEMSATLGKSQVCLRQYVEGRSTLIALCISVCLSVCLPASASVSVSDSSRSVSMCSLLRDPRQHLTSQREAF